MPDILSKLLIGPGSVVENVFIELNLFSRKWLIVRAPTSFHINVFF